MEEPIVGGLGLGDGGRGWGRSWREICELMEIFWILIVLADGYTVFTFVKTYQALHLDQVHLMVVYFKKKKKVNAGGRQQKPCAFENPS